MDTRYNFSDDSGDTSQRVIFSSGVSPIGALIHTTAGRSSLAWLQGGSARAGKPAGADYLIDKDGSQHKICPGGYRPYHAGVGRAILQGRLFTDDRVSAMLLGIELEQQGEEEVTYEQFDSCALVIVKEGIDRGWRWPYTLLGHYETARPVGRRSDPQGFPWGDFMGRLLLHARSAGVLGL